MKTTKIYLGILLSAMLLLFANCTIREGEYAGAATQRGFQIYKTCEYNTIEFIDKYVDICFNLNTWIEADSSFKYLIEDKWFPNYKIRNVGDGIYGLYANANLVYTIETGNLPLTDPNAKWVLSWNERDNNNGYSNYGQIALANSFRSGSQELHIDNLGTTAENSWHVTIAEQDSSESFLDLTLVTPKHTIMQQSVMEDDFTVTGTGKFLFLEGRLWSNGEPAGWEHHTYLSFEIQAPMQFVFAYEGRGFHGGKMDLEASNLNGDKLPVGAQFKGPYNIEITYKDKTQIWNINTETVTE